MVGHSQGHPGPREAGTEAVDSEQTSSTKSQRNTPTNGGVEGAPHFRLLPSHSPAFASASGSARTAEQRNPVASIPEMPQTIQLGSRSTFPDTW